MNGIVITTHKSTELFYIDLMKSLYGCKYPVVTVFNSNEDNQYESSGLEIGKDLFDNFVFLQDTVLIKNLSLFDKLFEYKEMVSISPRFLMYLGKYNSQILKQHTLQQVKNRRDGHDMEMWLGRVFPSAPCFDDKFIDGNHRFEHIHGRMNMVLENDYLIKMKGHWSLEMINKDL